MEHASHVAYIETFPDDVRVRLKAIQASVLSLFPDATSCISYRMPAFREKYVFIYFAAFKNHIGIYPPVRQDPALIQDLRRFRGPRGNLAFPFSQPLPMELIERVILALHREYAVK